MLTAREVKQRVLARRGIYGPPRPYEGADPAEFINREMYIPETHAPLTLHPEQEAVLRAMSERDANGDLLYSTWLYSAPKKSAKTTICAGVALWQALQVPDGQIYIIGNDQKQADNRMMQAIRYAVEHNPRFKGRARIVRYTIYLDNGTKIESIPVDPRGEAGMNPTGLFWTEAWGAIGSRPELLWTEAALSPTRTGQAFKLVESYAGYSNQSLILERLYNNIVKNGQPHPAAPELYTNQGAIGYWCTRRYLEWQDNPKYYAEESRDKTPAEFARIHDNQWSKSTEAFIPEQWWDACKVEAMEPLGSRTVIMGIDAAVENDCFAIVIVSMSRDKKPQVRYVKIWKPSDFPEGSIQFDKIEASILELFKQYNVGEVAYDPYQMESTAQRLKSNVFWQAFQQGSPRLIADKRLYDMIRDRQIEHSGEAELRQHVINADRKPEDTKLRIIKRAQHLKIDAVVALSMAVDRAAFYNL